MDAARRPTVDAVVRTTQFSVEWLVVKIHFPLQEHRRTVNNTKKLAGLVADYLSNYIVSSEGLANLTIIALAKISTF